VNVNDFARGLEDVNWISIYKNGEKPGKLNFAQTGLGLMPTIGDQAHFLHL